MPSTRALIIVSYALNIMFTNFARSFIKGKTFNLCFEFIERFSVFHVFWVKNPNNWAHFLMVFRPKCVAFAFRILKFIFCTMRFIIIIYIDRKVRWVMLVENPLN